MRGRSDRRSFGEAACCLLPLLAVVSLVTPALGAVVDGPPAYTCYGVKRAPRQRVPGVVIETGIDTATVALRKVQHVCAPASANGRDPAARELPDFLTEYGIRRFKRAIRRVRNLSVVPQDDAFPPVVVDLQRPVSLLVPSTTQFVPGPTHVNHFTCYRVRGGRKSIDDVGVEDRFRAVEFDVKRPTRLCLATRKNGEPVTERPPGPTTLVKVDGNLAANAPLIPGGIDGATFETAFATSNFSGGVDVIDSRAARHRLTMFFTRTGTNLWEYATGADHGELLGDPGDLIVLSTGTLVFNPDGSLSVVVPYPPIVPGVTFIGANAQDIELDLGTPNPIADPGAGRDGLVQLAIPSTATFRAQGDSGSGGALALLCYGLRAPRQPVGGLLRIDNQFADDLLLQPARLRSLCVPATATLPGAPGPIGPTP